MRQAERRAKTLHALLEAAGATFARRGYEGTSLDAVVATAGLSKGALYAHFATKLDLFLAIVDLALADARGRLELSAGAIGRSPSEAAARYFDAPDEARHMRLMTEAWRLALEQSTVRERLDAFRSFAPQRLAEAAIAEGLAPQEALGRADVVAKLIDALMLERQLALARSA